MLETIVMRFGTWRHRIYWETQELDIIHYHRIYWGGMWTPFCRRSVQ